VLVAAGTLATVLAISRKPTMKITLRRKQNGAIQSADRATRFAGNAVGNSLSDPLPHLNK